MLVSGEPDATTGLVHLRAAKTGGGIVVNTYDPADSIVYVHMAPESDPWSRPVVQTRRCTTLPTGYANQSPRTRLRTDSRSVGTRHSRRSA